MEEKIKTIGSKKYRAVEFEPTNELDRACKHCAFEQM